MQLIPILIVSAGMSLGLVGPDHNTSPAGADGANAKDAGCADAQQEGSCPLCADHEAQAPKELPKIDSAAYSEASWPEHNSGQDLYAKDFQGQKLPVALGNETWLSEKTDLTGKVLVLDFWATWCGPCRAAAPKLADLQAAHEGELAVVAISGQRENEETVRGYLEDHEEKVVHLFDAKQRVFREFESKGIPLVVVLSTDGVVRWIGNPHDEHFKPAVEQVLRADPMVRALAVARG